MNPRFHRHGVAWAKAGIIRDAHVLAIEIIHIEGLGDRTRARSRTVGRAVVAPNRINRVGLAQPPGYSKLFSGFAPVVSIGMRLGFAGQATTRRDDGIEQSTGAPEGRAGGPTSTMATASAFADFRFCSARPKHPGSVRSSCAI